MHGYEPRRGNDISTWREALLMMRIAFGVLLPIVGAMIGVVALIVASLLLMDVNRLLALAPLLPIGGGVWWLIRRDRRVQAEMERDIHRGRYL